MHEVRRPTIGILYPGEMGSALGKLLAGDGCRVVTTLEGRSDRTARLCREAGLEVLDSFADVVRLAGVVFSVVPPAQALPLAERYREAARGRSPAPLFVDANSVSPLTVQEIAARLGEADLPCVDAAVHGLAAQLRSRGTVYLSGPEAPRVAGLLEGLVRVRVMGDRPGQASALKMLIAGLNKGLVALFLELGLLAREGGLLPELVECCKNSYPGVAEVVERLLPTFPQHAARRGQEMQELERTMEAAGLTPAVVRGTREIITALGRLGLPARPDRADERPWTVAEVIEESHRLSLLR